MKLKRSITYILAVTAALAALSLFGCGHEHSFKEGRIVWQATCTREGLREDVCECGVKQSVKLPILEHRSGEWEVVSAADCENDGKQTKKCLDCGVLLGEEVLPALGHDLDTWEAQAPTCTLMGYDAFELCAVCGYSNYESIPMTPHRAGPAPNCEDGQYCLDCGTLLALPLGHTEVVVKGRGANCVNSGVSDRIYCSVCDKVIMESIELPVTAHKPIEVDGVAPTCTEEGVSDGVICEFCDKMLIDQVVLPKAPHRFSDSRDSECNDCGAYRRTSCKHEKTERINRTVATCTRNGLTSGDVCLYCGQITSEQSLVEAKAHSYKIVEGFAPTATRPGLSDGVYCTVCKTVIKTMELIPPVAYVKDAPKYDGSYHEDYNGGKLEYIKNLGGDTCTVIGRGSCTSPYLVIPESIDGLTVTAVKDYAFRTDSKLCGITVSDTVKTIGDLAFSACPALVSVDMYDGTALGKRVFDESLSVKISYRHSFYYVPNTKETCEENGVREHFACKNCGGFFADANGETQMDDVYTQRDHFFVKGVCEDCGVALSGVKVAEVIQPQSVAPVPVGTLVESIGLPEFIEVKTADRSIHRLPVRWDTTPYDSRYEGTYRITGYIEPQKFIFANTTSRKVSLAVTVKKDYGRMADVVLLVDTTFSMEKKLTELNAGMAELLEALDREGIIPRLGLIEFKSNLILGSYTAKQVKNGNSLWFDSPSGYLGALSSLKAESRENSESSSPIDALMIGFNNMGARKDVPQFYVLISDGYCTPTNSFGFSRLNQITPHIRKDGLFLTVIAPESFKGSYSSFLETDNTSYVSVGNDLEAVFKDQIFNLITENVE